MKKYAYIIGLLALATVNLSAQEDAFSKVKMLSAHTDQQKNIDDFFASKAPLLITRPKTINCILRTKKIRVQKARNNRPNTN